MTAHPVAGRACRALRSRAAARSRPEVFTACNVRTLRSMQLEGRVVATEPLNDADRDKLVTEIVAGRLGCRAANRDVRPW